MTAHTPQAAICFDPFHAIGPVTDAVEKFRRARGGRNYVPVPRRSWPDSSKASGALLKNPDSVKRFVYGTFSR